MTTRPSGPQPHLPITIVTGFLGSGKTTLLNRLLRDPALADTVVIVNEFGKIGLDHLLIEHARDDMVLLGSGCLCCTVRGDLVRTLEDLLRKRDNGRITPFRRIVIETTGLADPAPVMNAAINHPYLSKRFDLDGVVTLVDAVNGLASIEAHDEAARQVAVADRLLITKADLAGADLDALIARIRLLNPAAPILVASETEPDAQWLTGLGPYALEGRSPDVAAWLQADIAGGDQPQRHDTTRHGERIFSFTLVDDRPLPAMALDVFLANLRAAKGANVLRMKGLVALDDDPHRPVLLHMVQHVVHPILRLERWPDDDERTRIVFILQDLDADFVRNLWLAPEQPPA